MKKDYDPKDGQKQECSIDERLADVLNIADDPILFDEEVYGLLPPFFNDIVQICSDRKEADIALFCSLVLISGVLPNYKVDYNGDHHEANLYGYMYGFSGVGKGIMKKCQELIMPIHREKKQRAQAAVIVHERQKAVRRDKSSAESEELPLEGIDNPAACNEMLLMPANVTKSKMYGLMADNDGHAIICETEASTLSIALRQEHGGFSDLILKAFHHEMFSCSRKSDGTVEIENPYLTMMLSSTPNHLFTFFGDTENGLFSRFLFYMAPSTPEFKNPFEKKRSAFIDTINTKSAIVKKIYDQLIQCKDAPLFFGFTPKQSKQMQVHFQKLKDEYRMVHTEEMDGIIHRYALIFTRIAMILSIHRSYNPHHKLHDLEDNIICTEDDFKCSMMLIMTLLDHGMKAYDYLMQFGRKTFNQPLAADSEKLAAKQQCIELYLQGGLTYRQIAAKVLNNAKLSGTIHRWLKKEGLTKK